MTCFPTTRPGARCSNPARASSWAGPAIAGSRRRRSRPPSCSHAAWGRRPTSSARRCTPSTMAAGAPRRRAPAGPAPVCRASLEHGMHKLPQPVKLWYLSSFFRAEAPQRGRYRQFWQVGAEAIGSATPETDAELILLLAELLEALGVRDTRLRLSSLGSPDR